MIKRSPQRKLKREVREVGRVTVSDTFQECSHSREPKAQEKSSKMISHCWIMRCFKMPGSSDSPSSPVVKDSTFHCRGRGFDPWLETEDSACHEVWPKSNKNFRKSHNQKTNGTH